jgi:hypothetical protein
MAVVNSFPSDPKKNRRWVETNDGFPIATQRYHQKVTTKLRSIG